MTRLWGNVVGNELCLDLAMFPHYGLTVLTFLQHQVQKNIGCFFARKKTPKSYKTDSRKKTCTCFCIQNSSVGTDKRRPETSWSVRSRRYFLVCYTHKNSRKILTCMPISGGDVMPDMSSLSRLDISVGSCLGGVDVVGVVSRSSITKSIGILPFKQPIQRWQKLSQSSCTFSSSNKWKRSTCIACTICNRQKCDVT